MLDLQKSVPLVLHYIPYLWTYQIVYTFIYYNHNRVETRIHNTMAWCNRKVKISNVCLKLTTDDYLKTC